MLQPEPTKEIRCRLKDKITLAEFNKILQSCCDFQYARTRKKTVSRCHGHLISHDSRFRRIDQIQHTYLAVPRATGSSVTVAGSTPPTPPTAPASTPATTPSSPSFRPPSPRCPAPSSSSTCPKSRPRGRTWPATASPAAAGSAPPYQSCHASLPHPLPPTLPVRQARRPCRQSLFRPWQWPNCQHLYWDARPRHGRPPLSTQRRRPMPSPPAAGAGGAVPLTAPRQRLLRTPGSALSITSPHHRRSRLHPRHHRRRRSSCRPPPCPFISRSSQARSSGCHHAPARTGAEADPRKPPCRRLRTFGPQHWRRACLRRLSKIQTRGRMALLAPA